MQIITAALALAAVSSPQEFEQSLDLAALPEWRQGGWHVEISGDWIGVNSERYAPSGGMVGRGVLMFRRSPDGDWDDVRPVEAPGALAGYGESGFGLDGEHLLMHSSQALHAFRFDPMADDWVPRPDPVAPAACSALPGVWWIEQVDVSGDRAIVVSTCAPGCQRRVHTYEFDRGAGTWVWTDDLVAPTGADCFGAWTSLSGETLVTQVTYQSTTFGIDDDLLVYERANGAWALSQVLEGSVHSPSSPYAFGAWSVIDGDVLVTQALENSMVLAKIFERPGPGAPFVPVAAFPGSPSPNFAVDGETVAAFNEAEDRIEVYRRTPCSSGQWVRTHRLNSIHLHEYPGFSLAVQGDTLVQASPACSNPPCSPIRPGVASVFPIPADLNGDGVVDACQTGQFEDVDADGLLDIVESPGSRFCTPNVPTSLGAPAQLLLEGSQFALENDLHVRMLGVPEGSFGLMLASQSFGYVPQAGGSAGNLCLAGHIGRRNGPIWTTYFSTSNNELVKPFDLSFSPTTPGVAMLPGETWYFQGWFRDGSTGSNFTDGMRLFLE